MKFAKIEILIDKGVFSSSDIWKKIESHIMESIKAVVWPPGSNNFTIYPESGKKRGKGNGVKPIKIAFLKILSDYGWLLEHKLDIATVEKPGKVDAVYEIGDKCFAL